MRAYGRGPGPAPKLTTKMVMSTTGSQDFQSLPESSGGKNLIESPNASMLKKQMKLVRVNKNLVPKRLTDNVPDIEPRS